MLRREICMVVLAGLVGVEPVAAQGFGWLFGEPPGRHAARTRRPAVAPADVPLPVPRPHFDEDAKAPAEAAKSGTLAASPPVAASTEASSSPPLPPERPPQVDMKPVAPAPAHKEETPSAAAVTAPNVDAAKPSDTPAVGPTGPPTAVNPRQPKADPACADRLKARGVETEPAILGPQPDARCTVMQPLRLVAAPLADKSMVSFPDKPTIACTTADAFSAYVHDLLAPLAKGTWGVPVTAVWTGPGLECRSRDHIFGAKLSAHGQGLAVDIAQLKLADGRMVAVGEPATDAERDFETAARAGGCGYFHTVLGPGSDTYHRTHWHFDLEVRGKNGDGKYCK